MNIGLDGRSRLSFILLVAVTVLTAITPLGKEATHPVVLLLYRTILLFIILAAGREALRQSRERAGERVCPYFLGAVGAYLLWSAAAVLAEEGSHFEGVYVFYQSALFIAAGLALAAFSRFNDTKWKQAVLVIVPLVGAAHLAGAMVLAQGERPLFGTFVNPNYLASYLLPGLAASMALAAFGQGWWRFCALASAALLTYGIVEAASRGGVLAAVLMLGVAVLRWRLKAVGAVAAAAALAAVYLVMPQSAVVHKFLDRGEGDPYNYARPLIWKSAMRIAVAQPLLGVGPGRYAYAAKLYTPPIEGTIARYRKVPNIAHSEYLQTMAERGVPAAALLVLLLAYLGYRLWTRAPAGNQEGGETSKPIHEAAILAAAGFAAHALVDNNWTVPVMASTLAIVSQADFLPWRSLGQDASPFRWTPAWRVLAVAAACGVLAQSAVIPAVAFYFNEEGLRADTAAEFQRAELMHTLATGVAPDHPVLLDNLGMVYLHEFKRTKKPEHLESAKTAFEAAIAANPLYDIPLGDLVEVLIRSLTGNPQTDRLIDEKIALTDRQLLHINPYNPFIRGNLAEALDNMGDRKAAEAELRAAIAIEPHYVPGYMKLADWRDEAGAPNEGAQLRARALDIVNLYRNEKLDLFETLLLGRPQ